MTTSNSYGIEGQLAPEPGVTRWVDAEGTPTEALTLAKMPGRLKILYCFQSWCPGCHSGGFPTLAKLVGDLREHPEKASFAVVQTVFEGFETNTFEAMLETRSKYQIGVPFGHDAGENHAGSELMRRYRCGGTPWFIVIGSDGRVLFNDFRLNPDPLVAHLLES